MPRVIAILAARNGAAYLPTTLDALGAQTRPADVVVAVDAGSSDRSATLIQEHASAERLVKTGKSDFGTAVRAGLEHAPSAREDDWLWLLAHDSSPAADALEQLLATIETSPSVVMAAPKLLRFAQSDVFAGFGETMTTLGASVVRRAGELDQGQHDADVDTMAAAATGLLVRRDAFEALGGFDPALPTIDAGLDLGVRARLAGYRVALTPSAEVASAGGPELFSARGISDASRTRIARRAQLHRRLAYAPAWAVPLHWLSLLPLAVIRAIGHLFAKRPASVVSEVLAALGALVSFGAVARARTRIRRHRAAPWTALAPLRLTARQVRAARLLANEGTRGEQVAVVERVGYIEGGGLWAFALAALASVFAFGSLLGAAVTTGGALLPLPTSIAELWRSTLGGAIDATAGVVGPADPFTVIVALLGSLTFWQPSLAITLLILTAMPIASFTAWWGIRTVTSSRWVPALAGLVWAFSPTLVTSLSEGRLGAVVAHLALPLLIPVVASAPTWRGVAAASLVTMIVGASAPSLVPLLTLGWIVALVVRWRQAHRLALLPIPLLVLGAPLIWAQIERGTPLALLADPGVPFQTPRALDTDLLLGFPDARLAGWDALMRALGLGVDAGWVAIALAAPLVLTALAAPFLRVARAVPALVLALLGIGTAAIAARISLTSTVDTAVSIWPGAGLSAYLLGLLAAAAVTLELLGRRAGAIAAIIGVFAITASAPALWSLLSGNGPIRPGSDQVLPGFVVAQAQADPQVGTLVITPLADGEFQLEIARGAGLTLDDVATFALTREGIDADQETLAQAAVNLAATSDVDVSDVLDAHGVEFILLEPGPATAGDLEDQIVSSLDTDGQVSLVGDTDYGRLWSREIGTAPEVVEPAAWALPLLFVQLGVMLLAALLALPSLAGGARHRVRRGRPVSKDFA